MDYRFDTAVFRGPLSDYQRVYADPDVGYAYSLEYGYIPCKIRHDVQAQSAFLHCSGIQRFFLKRPMVLAVRYNVTVFLGIHTAAFNNRLESLQQTQPSLLGCALGGMNGTEKISGQSSGPLESL